MPDTFDAGKMVEVLAPLLKLELKPEYHAGIKANLETAQRMAKLLEDVPLTDEAEPAPVFSA